MGTVYVPTVAQTEAGFYLDIDPVEVVPAADTESLQRTIRKALSSGNPIVATPTRATFPKPVVVKYAKVKSWSTFEKGTLVWTIVENSGNYQIEPKRKAPDRGWEDDPTKIESLPSGTTPDGVAQRVVALIQLSEGVVPPSVR
jgi:hypothetical protein